MRRHSQKLEVRYVPHYGEVGAGSAIENVLPFAPRDELYPVAIPAGSRAEDFGLVTVRGPSLSDLGIDDGDMLEITKRFSWREIDEDTICVVYIHATGELVAKRIVKEANMLTLCATGGGIRDLQYSPDEIEIRAIAYYARVNIKQLMWRLRGSGNGKKQVAGRDGGSY